MIVKINIPRLLGSSDDKEKKSKSKKSRQRKFYTPVKPTLKKLHTSVH